MYEVVVKEMLCMNLIIFLIYNSYTKKYLKVFYSLWSKRKQAILGIYLHPIAQTANYNHSIAKHYLYGKIFHGSCTL